MKAYPTLYRGIQFRSRLEAKWAAFFDNLGWPWEYEPIDLDGYIPDFILTFPGPGIKIYGDKSGHYSGLLLVEVKPALKFEDLSKYKDKIKGWEGEVLIVGAKIFYTNVIGLMFDRSDFLFLDWGGGYLSICPGCKRWTISHKFGSYHCRICNEEKAPRGSCNWELLWADACNKVQYFPKG